ncbi:MAG TPA: hypothetical protein PLP23_10370 [Panacibacter sp.]|nr:hypothetical protein [Panacibacter sp.]
MKNEELKQRLHHYIETAKEKKIKAIYMMVEEDIDEQYDFWKDENFTAELQRRENEYLKGTAKTYTLEESVNRAKQAVKKVK